MRILLVEDDQLLGEGIQVGLKQEGHTVEWLMDGLVAEAAILKETFDIIILDIGLPKKSGLDVLKAVRKAGINTPILMLTAYNEVGDRVRGLDAGADDYLAKPFSLTEITARLRALTRRAHIQIQETLKYKDIELLPASHTVTLKKQAVKLGRREFALLELLLKAPEQVVPRKKILDTLYGWEQNVESNTIEVHIHNLRKKFGNEYMHTIRGVGYSIHYKPKQSK